MILAILLLLLESPAATPSPTTTPTRGPAVGRTTPVPAGGSLRDVAKIRRGLSPEVMSSGSYATVAEGSVGWLRHEGLTVTPTGEGLLFVGRVVNDHERAEYFVLEIRAKRRDGTLAHELVYLDQSIAAKKSLAFAQVLRGPTDPGPTGLRSETAAAWVHSPPDLQHLSASVYANYLGRVECLSYWFKRLPGAATKEDVPLEVHVVNNCASATRAVDTWFQLGAEDGRPGFAAVRYGLFLDDVPPHGELKQVVPVKFPPNIKTTITPYRLR